MAHKYYPAERKEYRPGRQVFGKGKGEKKKGSSKSKEPGFRIKREKGHSEILGGKFAKKKEGRSQDERRKREKGGRRGLSDALIKKKKNRVLNYLRRRQKRRTLLTAPE